MKRITVVLFAVLVAAGAVFAQELTFSGELRTGFYLEQEQIGDLEPVARGGMTNTDGYSGYGQGRIRMNFDFTYENVGLRTGFQIEPPGELGPFFPTWNFAYAYGNLFNDQLTVSAGLLGESPWGTGGPELRRDPENREYWTRNKLSNDPYVLTEALMGIRFEYKPFFVPGLNVGFTLNQPDQKAVDVTKLKFDDLLGESVIGIAYEHEYFAARIGYRFDSKADLYSDQNAEEGGRLTYRLEERVLGTLVNGMKVWLNGCYYGIGCEQQEIERMVNGELKKLIFGSGEYCDNWLYWLWDADSFIAQFNTRFAMYKTYKNNGFPIFERQEYKSLEFRPAFYYKFFNNLLQAGVRLGFGMEFGEGKTYKDSPYQYIFVEPQIRFNLNSNAYLALVYNFTDKYAWWIEDRGVPVEGVKEGDKSVKHSVNLRAVYTF